MSRDLIPDALPSESVTLAAVCSQGRVMRSSHFKWLFFLFLCISFHFSACFYVGRAHTGGLLQVNGTYSGVPSVVPKASCVPCPLAARPPMRMNHQLFPPGIFSYILAVSPSRALCLWEGLPRGLIPNPTDPLDREGGSPETPAKRGVRGEMSHPSMLTLTSWAICP